MSVYSVDELPTPSDERTGGVARLARWFRPQEIRERASQRDQAVEKGQRIRDIKWRWRQACEVSGLARLVFTPTGPTMAIPLIGRVELGPRTTFTVQARPGQLLSDFEAAAPRIAAAMGVAAIRVRHLAADWLVIELLIAQPKLRSLTPPSELAA